MEAKKLKPNHLKAYQRGNLKQFDDVIMCIDVCIGALACVKLERYGEAVEWCDQGLRVCWEGGSYC